MTAVRRVLVASGTILIAYALLGAVTDPDVRLLGAGIFLAAVLILHDGVLLPLTIAAGALLGRLPAPARAPARLAAVIALAVTVVAVPLVLGYGRAADNPSILPGDYGRGLLLTLAVIGVPATVVAVVRTRAAARRPGK
jgi:hypothetical protein